MKLERNDPPRVFRVGLNESIEIKDCAHIKLEPDEQVTFLTESGAEYDVARKAWGFYATPSLNSRLQNFSLRGVLVKNRKKQYFVMLIERGQEHPHHQPGHDHQDLPVREALVRRRARGGCGRGTHECLLSLCIPSTTKTLPSVVPAAAANARHRTKHECSICGPAEACETNS